MPAKKNRNKKNKNNGSSKPSGMPRDGPFAPTMVRPMNYSEVVALTEPGASSGAYQIFRSGDVYDPDFSGTGHQPMYFDQLCTSTGPYLCHTTLRADFHIRIVNTSSIPIMVIAYPSMVTSVPSRTAALERPFAWKKMLPPVGTGGAMTEKKMFVDNPKFVGLPVASYEAAYNGNYGTSSGGPFMVISIWGLGGAVATAVVELNIVYTTKFFQLGLPGTS